MPVFTAKALLFDMDGTLIDSSAKVEALWRLWCDRHGIDLDHVMAIQQGVRSVDTMRTVAPHLDIDAEAAWMDEQEIADCEGIIEMPGALRLLDSLPFERWNVATSATVPVASKRLAHCGLPVPELITCAEHVVQGKPAPQIYELAAARLAMPASECIAFEDAPAGVQSALAAGCQVIQIGGSRPLDPAVLGILPDWREVHTQLQPDGRISLQFPERFATGARP